MAESIENFIHRIEKRTGMTVNRMPDGEDDDMPGGAIIANSSHGTLVYLNCYGQDEETGVDLFRRCVLIRRSNKLPAADEDADGAFSEED